MGERLRAARVPPPGRIIRRELDVRGWTQKDLAHIMDRPEQTISQIVNAKKRVTPETALQLHNVLSHVIGSVRVVVLSSRDFVDPTAAEPQVHPALRDLGPADTRRAGSN